MRTGSRRETRGQQSRPVSWLGARSALWRAAALVALALAMAGPWTFDRVNVPSEYACPLRLDDDFCGVPISGLWLLRALIHESARLGGEWLHGERGVHEWSAGLVAIVLACVLTLPFLATLLRILGWDKGLSLLAVAAWGLASSMALVIASLMAVVSSFKLVSALWGVWLYGGVATAAAVLEAFALTAERRWVTNEPSARWQMNSEASIGSRSDLSCPGSNDGRPAPETSPTGQRRAG